MKRAYYFIFYNLYKSSLAKWSKIDTYNRKFIAISYAGKGLNLLLCFLFVSSINFINIFFDIEFNYPIILAIGCLGILGVGLVLQEKRKYQAYFFYFEKLSHSKKQFYRKAVEFLVGFSLIITIMSFAMMSEINLK